MVDRLHLPTANRKQLFTGGANCHRLHRCRYNLVSKQKALRNSSQARATTRCRCRRSPYSQHPTRRKEDSPMPTDYQPSMQTVSPSTAIYPLPRDIVVIVALVLCLLAGSWVTLHLCHTLVSLSLGGMVVVPAIAAFLLYTTKGIFHFLCGYWLARLLRRVSPWYVVGGLAIVAALVILVLAGLRPHLDFASLMAVTAAPLFLASDVFGQDCLLLFLSLGIWFQRRMSHKR